jgi:hypothetical protein
VSAPKKNFHGTKTRRFNQVQKEKRTCYDKPFLQNSHGKGRHRRPFLFIVDDVKGHNGHK